MVPIQLIGFTFLSHEINWCMRYLPHTLYLMALRGRKTLRGRPLPSVEDAVKMLGTITGQNFGQDAQKWSVWIKANRNMLYKSQHSAEDTTVNGRAANH